MIRSFSIFAATMLCTAFIAGSCTKDEPGQNYGKKTAASETPGEQASSTVAPETKSATVASGRTLSLTENYIRKNTYLKAEMKFSDFGGVTLARGGSGVFYGYWLEVTPTQVISYRYTSAAETLTTVNHGLNISGDLTVVLNYRDGSDAAVTLTSGSASKTVQVEWWGGGVPSLTNNGPSDMEAALSFIPYDCEYTVWIIGDSYIDWKYDARWPYYLYKKGCKKWMADHLPGAGSAKMYASFKYDLGFGKPDFIIWAMGMNDGADGASSPVSTWLTSVQKFIADCEAAGITPVLTTVPSIPTRDHSKKTKWVRESGYRYIDFSAAVTDNDARQWRSGYLSSDGIHPASAGAKALAEQVEKDFPEIKNTK